MNQQIFETAYAAYQTGDWATAADTFLQAKDPNEVSGKLDHLRGNALMKLGKYDEAADAYKSALEDPSYQMVGALCTNRGRALIAAGRLPEAVESLQQATQDESYATPYKAYMALGGACRALGDVRGAGMAYRNAAIDEANPDPSTSLRKLGGCFMDLGRPADAVESYRTALDFSSDAKTHNAIYCDLAFAYVAANRMGEAVDAFDHATADGTYVLSPEAQASYDAARNAVAARSGERRVSDTDDMLAAAGYGPFDVDPLDPTGATSENLMPSPEDTGFFSVNEEELVKGDREKRRGRGGKVVLIIVILLVILAGAAGFAYYSGFGWPTQEKVVQDIFAAKTNHEDAKAFVSGAVDPDGAEQIVALVPSVANITITGVNRAMRTSEVMVTASLPEGGEQSYKITLSRDGIGWKVSGIDPVYVSLGTNSSSQSTSESSSTSSGNAQPAANPEGDASSSQTTEQGSDTSDGSTTEGSAVEETEETNE